MYFSFWGVRNIRGKIPSHSTASSHVGPNRLISHDNTVPKADGRFALVGARNDDTSSRFGPFSHHQGDRSPPDCQDREREGAHHLPGLVCDSATRATEDDRDRV